MSVRCIYLLRSQRIIPKLLNNFNRKPQFVSFIPYRLAGHSHWQNVRHTKEAKDKERARVTSFILMQVDAAVKESGGIRDPKLNSKLASVIADAKSKNVPMDTINRRLAAQDMVDPYVIEIQAPGGIFGLVETRCKAAKAARDKIQGIAKKYGFKVSKSPGSIASEFFEHRGIVTVKPQEKLGNIDAATEMAIECGAHDVSEGDIDENVKGFEFHCGVNEVDMVRQALEAHGVSVYESACPYIPTRAVAISSDSCKLILEMFDRIRDSVDYVENCYHNCEPE